MGKKSWISSVKKVFSPDSKKEKKSKSKKNSNGNEKPPVPEPSSLETPSAPHVSYTVPPPPEEVKLTEVENEQTKEAYSEVATTVTAEAVTQDEEEAVQLTQVNLYSGKSKEEVAAIKIQTAFRGHLARRALRALRGLVRLKFLVEGPTVKRQTANTLKCMQSLSRVQSQINSRRMRMAEETQALQRQLLQKRAKELESLQMGEEWDDTLQSKEQIEAKLLSKYEAAMRRERAMAYSFSHQQPWKKTARSSNLLFMDPTNPNWGWSWLERWMAGEARTLTEKEQFNDNSSVKTAITGNEITKSYARHQLNPDKSNPEKSPSTPRSKASISVTARKLKSAGTKENVPSPDDDSKSIISVQSERNRRHTISASSIRDDESLGSSASVPSYMAPTQSAKAKLRMQSPLGPVENGGTPEKGPAANAKKRLSYPGSPARPRRHSGPPRVESSSIVMDHSVATGVVN